MGAVLGIESSVGGRRWSQKLKNDNESERLIYAIVQRYGLTEIVARLLIARKVPIDDVERFLNPKVREEMPDPLSLVDMNVAVDRLVKAIKEHEVIGIFADYDVDGATSSALLKNYLDALQIQNELYIPDRIKEGYGPSKESFENLTSPASVIKVAPDTVPFLSLEVLS